MELTISRQLLQLISSCVLGISAGILYDALRVLRRRLGLTALFDLVFWMLVCLGLFTLGMSIGDGALHIFMLLLFACGFGLYMGVASCWILQILNKIADLAAYVFKPVLKLKNFLHKAAKNTFSKIKVRFKMIKKSGRKHGGNTHEEVSGDHRADSDSAHRICYSGPGEGTE